jgi:hypothetical protein
MHDEEKKEQLEKERAYAAETSARLKKAIGEKLGEIRAMVMAESERMAECGGSEAAESILCALDCTCDQVDSALNSWEA